MHGSWKYRPPMRSPRSGHEVAVAGDDVFVLGGGDGSVETRKLRGSGVWREVGALPTPRAGFAAGVSGGLVHTAGGDGTDVVEVYDPAAGEWHPGPPLPVPLSAASAAGWGGNLYVAGGFVADGEQATNAVHVFAARHWSPVAPMRTPRARFRLIATATHLYALGGSSSRRPEALDSVERYDPVKDSWAEVAPMRRRRTTPGAALAGHRIAVVGGGPEGDRTTEVLDTRTGEWVLPGVLLPVARTALVCVATSPDRILAIGGSSGEGCPVPDVLSLKLTGARRSPYPKRNSSSDRPSLTSVTPSSTSP